ncbi:IPT/TIG domain-containing protein [Anaeromyxobacter terrae]|uniref:IPT/TIG domain-containing protein n=1 Tax=Anaeromyxobacter terrae TaxID=2925406 RepID=UPI001F566280|nr:IPT/TIG domain-containing protein [Anaeromyxobacter sp. SG22]
MKTVRSIGLAALLAASACSGGSGETEPYAAWNPAELHVDAVTPQPLSAGAEVTIRGRGFIRDPSLVFVRFGSTAVRAEAATPTELRVRVPEGLRWDFAEVQVMISSYESNGVTVPVSRAAR